ncbi:hypothetical protein [Streptomyces sp. A30]|uniref:hypothetical protein n=1 Tax=Streptomyces sp. A30 TaxID=2789273 RepID=UPI0039812106
MAAPLALTALVHRLRSRTTEQPAVTVRNRSLRNSSTVPPAAATTQHGPDDRC